jgi:hypothetical protein
MMPRMNARSGKSPSSKAGWHSPAPWWGSLVRTRVGMRLYPLAALLNALARAGLAIEHAAETGDRHVPTILALRSRKPV